MDSLKVVLEGYFYNEGYIRTSSKVFTLNNLSSKGIHLTNEAIQLQYDDFGKFEAGNKISFKNFHNYLANLSKKFEINFYTDIYPKIKVKSKGNSN